MSQTRLKVVELTLFIMLISLMMAESFRYRNKTPTSKVMMFSIFIRGKAFSIAFS